MNLPTEHLLVAPVLLPLATAASKKPASRAA